jgi:hypothetical protein
MAQWFPFLLVAHIALAVALLAPSVVVPFLLRARTTETADGSALRTLRWAQGDGALLIGLGLAVTGIALLATIGFGLLSQPWMLTALGLYTLNLLVAAFVARPNLRRLLGASNGTDEATWQRRARRQRWLAYGMAAATGVIGFLMSTKPSLW